MPISRVIEKIYVWLKIIIKRSWARTLATVFKQWQGCRNLIYVFQTLNWIYGGKKTLWATVRTEFTFFFRVTESAQFIVKRKKRWFYSLILLQCLFFLLGAYALSLIEHKITILFQALNFQTAVFSPGSILSPGVVDAVVEAFCYLSPAKFRH